MKTPIITNQAPAPIGPYSQAIHTGNILFLSGQIPIDPQSEKVILGTIEEEVHQVMKNIEAILKEAGMSLEDIVNSTIYLQNFDHFSRVNSVYESYLHAPFPARTTIEVSRLPKDVNVEIAVIASKL